MRQSNKTKRILTLCLCAVLLSAAFGGCTDKESGSVTEVQSSSDTASPENKPRDETPEVNNAAAVYSEDASVSDENYISTGTDENAVVVTDGNVALDNVTVKRESADSKGGDDSSFYGVGAAVLVKGGTAEITNAEITTDAKGGAGVFVYGDGVVKISDSTINTMQDTSGGIHAAGGGTLYAENVTAETQGESSAAVRSDRGGGLMVVSGGSYTSNGVGSPAVYCTATISAENAKLTANGSESVCIEGLNSLYLYGCDLSGNMKDLSQNDCTWNVILYQSMSGDSKVGNSTFQMDGGKLTAKNGGMFYTTNTESTFILKDVDIVYADENDFFLRCTGNKNQRGWGRTGANGAKSAFTAIGQDMAGNVIWDSISELDFYMTEGSTLTGAFVQDESSAEGGGGGHANLYIEDGSVWTVNGDSILTTLYNGGTIADAEGREVTVKGTDGTVYVSGASEFTVTVSSYETSADLSGAGKITAFEDAQVNNGYKTDGEMNGDPDGMGGMSPEMPNGFGDGNPPPSRPDGETPPEMPNGQDGCSPPEKPGGEQPSDKPEGVN